MNKRFILFPFILILIMSSVIITDVFARSCPDYAVACGASAVYNVTMNKTEVSTTGSSTGAVTIVETPQTFDIASANAGARVGGWFSGANLPPGTYNWMRRTVSRTFSGKGYVTSGGYDWYTSNNPDTSFGSGTNLRRVATGAYTFIGTSVPSDYAEINFSVPTPPDPSYLPSGMTMTADSIVQEDTSTTVIIEKGRKSTMRITFNVGNTLQLQITNPPTNTEYKLFLGEPDASVTINYE